MTTQLGCVVIKSCARLSPFCWRRDHSCFSFDSIHGIRFLFKALTFLQYIKNRYQITMKRVSSVVWQFFDRLEENNRCVAVLCKLCDCEYKYFGNTTNLRVHLIKKHPIQWDLRQTGWDGQKSLDESALRTNFDDDESTNQSTVSPKRRKYARAHKDKNVRYSLSVKTPDSGTAGTDSMPKIEIKRVDVLEHSETEIDHRDHEESEATLNLVRQMHNPGSEEEWLEEDYHTVESFQPKRKKVQYRKIKREIVTPPRVRSSNYRRTPTKSDSYDHVIVSEKKDEYSVFGEYIANKLRKFKAPRTRGNIQQLITTILWQAEYGVYDDADSVKRVLMESVQVIEPEQNTIEIEQEAQYQITETAKEGTNQSVESEALPLIN